MTTQNSELPSYYATVVEAKRIGMESKFQQLKYPLTSHHSIKNYQLNVNSLNLEPIAVIGSRH